MEWKKIGEGNYNKVYKNTEETLVLKISKNEAATDEPNRAVNTWNEVNPNLNPKAELYDDPKHNHHGWTAPLIIGENSSDIEIAIELIEIFNRSGRIVVDAYVPGNFKTTAEGKVICIDIGMALKLNSSEDISIVSRKTWHEDNAWEEYQPYIGERQANKHRHTIDVIKALYFIQSYKNTHEDSKEFLKDVSFLLEDHLAIDLLANAHSVIGGEIKQKGLNYLEDIIKIKKSAAENKEEKSIENNSEKILNIIKLKCIWILEEYINLHSNIKELKPEEFKPATTTKLFRNTNHIIKKFELTKNTINKLEKAENFDEIKNILKICSDNPLLSPKSTLTKKLAECQKIVAQELEKQATNIGKPKLKNF